MLAHPTSQQCTACNLQPARADEEQEQPVHSPGRVLLGASGHSFSQTETGFALTSLINSSKFCVSSVRYRYVRKLLKAKLAWLATNNYLAMKSRPHKYQPVGLNKFFANRDGGNGTQGSSQRCVVMVIQKRLMKRKWRATKSAPPPGMQRRQRRSTRTQD